MTVWLAATIALLPPLALACFIAATSRTGDRLVAVQLATAITAFMLVLMSFAFKRDFLVDLPLTLTLLSLPGTLLLALFLERWL